MQPTFEIKKIVADVPTPKLGTKGAAAFDLQAVRICNEDKSFTPIENDIQLLPMQTITIGTGLAIHMCRTDVGALIMPRSGRGSKGLVVGNLVGLIDSDYQGELMVCLWNRNSVESGKIEIINHMERIAQLMFVPVLQVSFKEVVEFSADSERGDNGFGSTGGEAIKL